MARRVLGGATKFARNSKTVKAIATKIRKSPTIKAAVTKFKGLRTGGAAAAHHTVAGAGAGASGTGAAAAGSGAAAAHHIVPGAGAAAGAAGAEAGAGAAGAGTAAAAAIAGPVIAVGIAAAGTAFALHQMISAIHGAAEALEDMSPEIATVKAEFEAMHEMARLDRAGRIGAGAAQLEAARGRIGESMYELQTKMLEILLKASPVLIGILDGINAGVRGVDLVISTFNNIWAKVNDLPVFGGNVNDNAAAAKALEEAVKAFGDAVKEMTGGMPHHDPGMDPFLAEVLNMPIPGGNPAPAPPAPVLGGIGAGGIAGPGGMM